MDYEEISTIGLLKTSMVPHRLPSMFLLVQIVTYLEHLFRVEKQHGPFLVVVPLSTVEHWRREFEGWTDMQVRDLNVKFFVYIQSPI